MRGKSLVRLLFASAFLMALLGGAVTAQGSLSPGALYDTPGEAVKVVVDNRHVYVADGNEGLQVFSGAGSATLVRLASYRPRGIFWA